MNQQYVYSANGTSPVNSMFMKNEHSGDRLRHVLQASGKAPGEFAFLMKISPQTLNNWFVRGVPGRQILTVSKLLRVQPDWLESGVGFPLSEMEIEQNRAVMEMGPEQLEAWLREKNLGRTRRPARVFSYPEISWELAGGPLEKRDSADFEDRIRHSTDADAGENGFWLSVKDSSMTSSVGITFPERYLILVSPDLQPTAGHFVLVRIPELNEATFKQLVIDAGDWYLKPLNPAFPMRVYEEGWEVIGTVVDAMIPSQLLNLAWKPR
jgi:SOS-response transcriptional repressor LexA